MEILETYSLYALLISNAALICGAALAVLRFERMVRRNRLFWDSPTGASTQAAHCSGELRPDDLESRLTPLRQEITELTESLARQHQFASVGQSVELPFQQAARMAKQGASVEDLTRTCGLKKAEAQLIRRLHAQSEAEFAPH